MRRIALTLVVLAAVTSVGSPATASPAVSFGYSWLKFLKTDAGSAPLGAYLSFASSQRAFGLEADVAYHRKKDEIVILPPEGEDPVVSETRKLETYTASIGPRWGIAADDATHYVHLLASVRHDRFEGLSSTTFGLMTGAGIDIETGGGMDFRLAADFQIYWDEGETLKSIRLSAGLTF